MKSISKLKDEARKHEQREEWEKAIQAYLQVLRIAEEGEEEVELPLYNRLGDLCVRLGKAPEAVRHYEQAADRYAEAGLYNNAIALCNKALRYSPDRLELIRKLGQFSASQGFITDARRYFLDYAERQFKAGKVTEALTALEDFANVSDDAEVREMLGRQLHTHGRINDAVDELRRAHAMRLRDGETDKAEGLRAEILAIDPSASLDGTATRPEVPRPRDTTSEIPGLVDIDTGSTDQLDVASFEDPAATSIEGLEMGALPGDGDAGLEPIELAGFETTGEPVLDDIDTTGGIEGLETSTLDFETVEADAVSLDNLGIERDEMSFGDSGAARDAEAFDLPLLDDADAGFDLPGLDEPAGSFDLPLLGDDDTVEPEEPSPLRTPEIDDQLPPLDLPDATEPPTGTDVPGDLTFPLDLTSFDLGTSGFDLTTTDEPAETAAWTSDEQPFELPTLDDDVLGTPTWEPEETTSLELPSFEAEVESEVPFTAGEDFEPEPVLEEPVLDQPVIEEPVFEEPVFDEPVAEEPVTEDGVEGANPGGEAVIDIPAIELPTWDTDTASTGTGDQAADEEVFELPASDSVEPTWIEAVEDEEESGPDLPTFTYEDEPDVETAMVEEDDDPLGLAAHLAGQGIATPVSPRPPARPDSTPPPAASTPPTAVDLPAASAEPEAVEVDVPGLDESAETVEVDSDWLDEIADDEAVVEEPDPWDEPRADAGDGQTAEATESAPPAAVEDVARDAGLAETAAREMAAAPPPAAPPPATNSGYIDLGAFIASDDGEETTRFRVKETAPTGDEDRDFAELLSQFKSKVQEHLPPEDAAAHYDLGLAFKEMGLVDEAIGEFQVALRAGHMRLRVYEELGHCFLMKEQYNIAQKVLSRALEMKYEDELELLGVYYHLGRAYEALGRRDEARDAYERVLGMDINFGDVTSRLAQL